jgi:hypothetical protein
MDRRIGRQGGWVGLIGMLLALAIVAWLARDALRAYGLLPSSSAGATKTERTGERVRAAGALGPEAVDLSSAPSSQAPIERARGVEDMVKQQAEQRAAQSENVGR